MGTHAALEAIKLEELTKTFGKTKAVDALTLSVAPGEVLGFLGPNGAGKTTTMRMLTGLIKPTAGVATISGYDVSKRSPKMLAKIGYLPGSLNMYQNLTGAEFLRFLSKMRKMNCESRIRELADQLQVDLHKHIHDLSKGNRQKVGVISAFMHDPEVLILDEPTSGLDPLVQREFVEILATAKKRGAATLLSSHVLSEVENLSNRVAIIHQGRLVLLEEIAQLKLHARHRIDFSFDSDTDTSLFSELPNCYVLHQTPHSVLCEVTGTLAGVLELAVHLGATGVRTEEPNLDDIFLDLIKNAGGAD